MIRLQYMILNNLKWRNCFPLSFLLRNHLFPYSYFYDWLRTGTLPSLEYLEALAEYFNVSTDYFLGRTTIGTNNKSARSNYLNGRIFIKFYSMGKVFIFFTSDLYTCFFLPSRKRRLKKKFNGKQTTCRTHFKLSYL